MSGQSQDIDPAALAREVDAIPLPEAPAGTLPPAEGAPAAGAATAPGADAAPVELTLEQAQAAALELAPKMRMVVNRFADRVIPAWELTAEEKKGIADDIALVVVLWAPDLGALPPKWLAVGALVLSAVTIADARRDTDGKLLPRKIERAQRPAAANGASAPNNTGAGGGFSTSS